jgi:hypothetical protein
LLQRAGRVSYRDRSDQTTFRFRSSIEAEGAKAVSTVIHDRRIEVPAPADLADGTEVILTISTVVVDDGGPMSPAEITRVLAAMERMQPLEIPDGVATDLNAWERTLNQRGIEHTDKDIEDASP